MKQLSWCLLVAVAVEQAGAQVIMNGVPAREFGQHALARPITSATPNLIEGRELNTPSSIAFDTSVSPPIMYVADTGNNRVLAWRDPASLGVCGTSAPATCGAADMVIGQADKFSSLPQGPGIQGSTLSTGFNAPTAVAVDSTGNLYVADAGNNRILRFPVPFQSKSTLQVDLLIGQSSLSSGSQPNQGQTVPSAQTLAFTAGGAYFRAAMAFDSAGNLWITDPGNNRVLRFPGPNSASNQLASKTSQPMADIVLGQTDFTLRGLSPNASATRPDLLSNPIGLAFDLNGGLYVLDGYARVLYFVPLNSTGFQTGQAASRILGIVPVGLTYPNRYSLGVPNQVPPQGIFMLGNALYVCDTAANRVVNFDVPTNWPAATSSAPSPPAIGVLGQADLVSGNANRGQVQPDATTLSAPVGGAVLNGELWVVDALNHRVVAYPKGNSGGFAAASRVVGQLGFTYNSVNLIEGREVFFNSPNLPSAGVVVDGTSTPLHLYIADSQNNRILGFNDARNVQAGIPADIVIGQPDFYSSVVNYPDGSNSSPSSTSLNNPTGLAVDSSGNLLVADSGNGRVLRFPSPFSQPSGAMQAAELVIGQSTFADQNFDVGQQTMETPFGLALFADGSLAVSDAAYNRVLIFARPNGGDFTSGQPASSVLGQPNFVSTNRSSSSTGLNSPRHLAIDSSGRLYVCDSGNDRVSIFSNARVAPNGLGAASLLPGLQAPQGVIVSAITGEFWVADTNNQRLLHFPEYNTAIQTGQPEGQPIPSNGPIAVALDPYDNLIVAELANRVTFYFAQLAYRNAANYNTQPVAPGSLTYVARQGVDFSFTPASSSAATWPATLNGIQVLMNGVTPCPIYLITSTAVYFQVPMSAPTSGFADFQVLDISTGQIYANAELPMGVANPGFFTLNSQGFGQAAAVNTVDGTVNGPSHPVSKDGKSYIQFYLTGLGVVPGAPPDGVPPPQPIPAPLPTLILSTGCLDGVCPDSSVEFSGVASYPGVWVINFLVPNTFPAGCNNVIAAIYNNTVSNNGANGKVQVTFCTK
jgi:uncharacterized protein (TIGR03437 family)